MPERRRHKYVVLPCCRFAESRPCSAKKEMERAFSGTAALGIVLRRDATHKKTRERVEKKPHSDNTIVKQTSQVVQESQNQHPPVDGLAPETFCIQLGHAARLRAVWSVLPALHAVVYAITPLMQLTHRHQLLQYKMPRQMTGFTSLSTIRRAHTHRPFQPRMKFGYKTGRTVGHRTE
jgi:hypothetical protein